MPTAFSKRQLDVLRHAIVVNGNKALNLNGPGYAKCRTCVGAQSAEMTCIICDKTKSLDNFARSQRRNPDTARCLNCVQDDLDADPILEDKMLAQSDTSAMYGSTTATSQYDEGTTQKSFDLDERRSALRGTASSVATTDYDDDDDDGSVGGGVWVEPDREGSKADSNKERGRAFTAFDPQGLGHQRVSSPSEAARSVHSGWASWGLKPPVAGRDRQDKPTSYQPPVRKRNPGFAKIPGARFEKHEAPSLRIPESKGLTLDQSDDEQDEDYDIENFM
ncbi:hypothetical protein VTN02DRAFT_4932 [Thermoascus thermophilus]